ncbi:MAG: 16S rRNA (cytosine(967)-C(5))-methyltransferase RsmB [Candidatus Omnitrophica bacterium]|nr:16S rRNA (cytosine(967)-C(5))-methyltransferase RsmB [Candidatus Omnitrophota bacterium]
MAAFRVLESIHSEGKTLLDAAPSIEDHCHDARDRGLARDIAFGACRWKERIRHILQQAAPRLDNFPPAVQIILEMSVYQMLYLDRVPDYAVISEAVDLTRTQRFGGLAPAVNGILRAVSRTRDNVSFPEPAKDFASYLSTVHSHPKWLVDQWLNIWPKERVESFCRFNNTIAPLSLRVRIERLAALEKLEKMGFKAEADRRFADRILLQANGASLQELFKESDWVAQDGAAMLIAPILDPQPGWRIWDVSAAPGGKTTHLSDLTENKAQILASDNHAERLKKIEEQKTKLGLTNVSIQKIDARRKQPLLEKEPFDAILVDAPCSGWGTFRRHPDLRWRLQREDSQRFARQALQILENVQLYLKPDGVLVYGTCTLSPEENEQLIAALIERHPEFQIEPVKEFLPSAFQEAQTEDGYLFVFPADWDMDGSFAARLRKS